MKMLSNILIKLLWFYEKMSLLHMRTYIKKVCGIEIELLNNDANFQEIIYYIYASLLIMWLCYFLLSRKLFLKIGAIYLPISYDYP